MAGFIGNTPAEKYTSLARQTFSSPTGDSFVLNYSVTNSDDLLLYVNSVKQDPGTAYSATGTSLTLTESLVSGDEMYALFYGRATETVNPPDDSVGLSQLAGGTDGNLITFDASGNPAYVATGSSGQVLISAGAGAPPTFSAAPAHTGNVAFPATQVASADANTLDDYQEGTWTPTNTSSSGFTAGITSYYGSTPSYTKIGRKVTIYGGLFFGNSSGTIATGDYIDIGGLPFSNNIRGSGGAKFIYNYPNWANVTVSMVGSQLLMQMATVSGSPNRVDSALIFTVTYDV